ncbi:MAG: manganese efflux pump MntP family protein [Candidatus Daviesbacteria bacterium]|nr:manganese efflux pump MntP family protein [Candidatus Daviesbacteria bacterium]
MWYTDLVVILQILLISISLSLDAFSVSIVGGMKVSKVKHLHALRVAAFFGIFQAVMPVIGWFIGEAMKGFIGGIDHWIAFGLLGIIGINMIRESLSDEDSERKNLLDTNTLIFLAVATSIDALVVGITLSLIKIPFILSISIIGLVTFIICFFGFLFGEKLGARFGKKIEVLGGLALIAIGIKILIEHIAV